MPGIAWWLLVGLQIAWKILGTNMSGVKRVVKETRELIAVIGKHLKDGRLTKAEIKLTLKEAVDVGEAIAEIIRKAKVNEE